MTSGVQKSAEGHSLFSNTPPPKNKQKNYLIRMYIDFCGAKAKQKRE